MGSALRLHFFRPFTFDFFSKSAVLIPRIKCQARWTHRLGRRAFPSLPFAGFSGDSRVLTDFLPPLNFSGGLLSLFRKSVDGGELRTETRTEWAIRLGQGRFVFVFQAGPWVYRTTPRHRGVFEAKIFLLSPAHLMPRCNKAPVHTNYRIPPPVRFAFPSGGLE